MRLWYNSIMFKNKWKINLGKYSSILLAVCAVLVALDLVLKWGEEEYLWNFTVIPNFIWVEGGKFNRNPGAAFSFLAGKEWGQAFLITVTFIMLAALVAVFLFLPERFTLLKLAVVMVIAGAVGNLVDRLMFREVRDFVWINMGFSTACCNFADFWIVIGTVIAVLDLLFFNEWAVFPLTKKAKAAQAERGEQDKKSEQDPPSEDQKTDGEQ